MNVKTIIICILSTILCCSLIWAGIECYRANKYLGQYRELDNRFRDAERRAEAESRELAERITECTDIAAGIAEGFNRTTNTLAELRDRVQQAREQFERLEDRLYNIKRSIPNYDSNDFDSDDIEMRDDEL